MMRYGVSERVKRVSRAIRRLPDPKEPYVVFVELDGRGGAEVRENFMGPHGGESAVRKVKDAEAYIDSMEGRCPVFVEGVRE